MAESFDERLTKAEGYIAESRDDNDPIRLSEITERIQEVIHALEEINLRIEGIENQIKAMRWLTVAIGVAVATLLLERLL